MNLENIKILLTQVQYISNSYEKMAAINGNNFNVFKTLNLQSSEVRMHSAFLAEFLNPKGSHGQKDKYLKIFIEMFGLNEFDSSAAIIEVEKNIGPKNEDETKGGRIDIVITDEKKRRIIIENKIYTGEQNNQLLRYHNFDKNATLFFLSLDGKASTDLNIKDKINPEKLKLISYREEILLWLRQCQMQSISLPIIRETIAQYINLILVLTEQTIINEMEEEIKQLILKHPDFVESIENCTNALNSIVWETKLKFEKYFNETFPEKEILSGSKFLIRVYWSEDSDGVFIGWSLISDGKPVNQNELGLNLANILRDIEPSMKSNPWHIGWFNPFPFSRNQRFENLPKSEIIKMYSNTEYLKEFVNRLVKQENEISIELLNRIKSISFE